MSQDQTAVIARLRAAGCVFAEDEARLLFDTAGSAAHLTTMVDRRVAGEPLEQVLGWAEFCGLRIVVEPGVFVPRRRTEQVVREAVRLAGDTPDRLVVDLCCGSGAVAAALAAALPAAEVYAADIDPAAVRCARRNLPTGQVYQGDLFAALPSRLRGRIDVLSANVPYVPTGEIGLLPPEARLHEPRTALDGGADGLDVLRRVAAEASRWLVPGGHLLTEASERQDETAAGILARHELTPRIVRSGEWNTTVVIGTRPD